MLSTNLTALSRPWRTIAKFSRDKRDGSVRRKSGTSGSGTDDNRRQCLCRHRTCYAKRPKQCRSRSDVTCGSNEAQRKELQEIQDWMKSLQSTEEGRQFFELMNKLDAGTSLFPSYRTKHALRISCV